MKSQAVFSWKNIYIYIYIYKNRTPSTVVLFGALKVTSVLVV